jgi:hypothetical protein
MRTSVQKAMIAMPLVAAALLGVGGVAVAAPAGTANEPMRVMDCSHPHSNKDSGEGRTTVDLRYRTGPHTSCTALGLATKGTLVYYHCWTRGTEVLPGKDTWTWGRVAGTQKQGWFYDGYLSDGGATKRC